MNDQDLISLENQIESTNVETYRHFKNVEDYTIFDSDEYFYFDSGMDHFYLNFAVVLNTDEKNISGIVKDVCHYFRSHKRPFSGE